MLGLHILVDGVRHAGDGAAGTRCMDTGPATLGGRGWDRQCASGRQATRMAQVVVREVGDEWLDRAFIFSHTDIVLGRFPGLYRLNYCRIIFCNQLQNSLV
jgi:hypothetical protein